MNGSREDELFEKVRRWQANELIHDEKRRRSGLFDQESVVVLGDVHDQAVQ